MGRRILKYNRIQNMRNEKNLSKKQVCEHIGISQAALSRYEDGQQRISIKTLAQLALLYDTSIDYLLELTDQKEPHTRKE